MPRRGFKEKVSFEDFDEENSLFHAAFLREWEKVAAFKDEAQIRSYISSFEEKFAVANHSVFCLAVNSGTSALEAALSACSVGPGHEVILPAYTYISSALAVSNTGARPRFSDIKPDTLTLDPEDIPRHLTSKTKAIIAVHVHGNPADMNAIMRIAKMHRLKVIEDCSHAHGATYRKKKVGNFGVGCFSCQATKNLGSIGNAGIVTCNDRGLFETMKDRLDVRQDPDASLLRRTPCLMGPLEAAVLSTKLSSLNNLNAKRRQLADIYIKELSGLVTFQKTEKAACHSYRDFVIMHRLRDSLRLFLRQAGIETKIRYPVPLHLTSYYQELGGKRGDLPVAEKTCSGILHLPCRPCLKPESVTLVCRYIKNFLGRRNSGI